MKRLLWVFLLVGCGGSSPSAVDVAGDPCKTAGATCGAGAVCDPQALICACPAGAALCGADCAVLATDPGNCGGCGLACPGAQTCSAGRCSGGGCGGGGLDCGGTCVDPKSNSQHCGGCQGAGGMSCGDGQSCVNGACASSPCAFGAVQCNGACVSLDSSATNCGACGKTCAQGSLCSAGKCIVATACPAGLTMCGTSCVDLAHDPAHCGNCATTCGREEICGQENGQVKCRDYKFAGTASCPASCGDRACCVQANPAGGYSALCVEDQCPLPPTTTP